MPSNNLNAEIGARIRRQREFLGYTREVLSEKANISTQFLADIEMGRKSMTAATIMGLSSSLCVSSDYILFGKTSDTEANEKLSVIAVIEGMSNKERDGAIDILITYAKAVSSLRIPDKK